LVWCLIFKVTCASGKRHRLIAPPNSGIVKKINKIVRLLHISEGVLIVGKLTSVDVTLGFDDLAALADSVLWSSPVQGWGNCAKDPWVGSCPSTLSTLTQVLSSEIWGRPKDNMMIMM
jgi:hypothetical protein